MFGASCPSFSRIAEKPGRNIKAVIGRCDIVPKGVLIADEPSNKTRGSLWVLTSVIEQRSEDSSRSSGKTYCYSIPNTSKDYEDVKSGERESLTRISKAKVQIFEYYGPE